MEWGRGKGPDCPTAPGDEGNLLAFPLHLRVSRFPVLVRSLLYHYANRQSTYPPAKSQISQKFKKIE